MDGVLSSSNNPTNLATSQTPKQFGFASDIGSPKQTTTGNFVDPEFGTLFNVPKTVPSTALSGDNTLTDVFAQRNQLAEQAATPTTSQTLDALSSAGTGSNFFANPENEINAILNRQSTEAEQQQQDILNRQSRAAGKIGDQLTDTERQATADVGLTQLQKNLAETEDSIARRTVQLRQTLRDFETNAERRGVARQFAENEKAKVQADATAELADLYIIQNAQAGNLDRAQQYIQTAVDNRYRSYQIQVQEAKAQLDALLPTLQGEEKDRALKLQLALGERERNLQTQKENDTQVRNLAMTAAENGASNATIQQILASKDVNGAISIASPFIGRYDRIKAQASLASASLSRRKQLVELATAGDPDAIKELGAYGAQIKQALDDAKTVQERQALTDNINSGAALEERINRYSAQLSNDAGWGLSTGQYQSPYLASIAANTVAGLGTGAAIGTAVGPLGTLGGAIAGTIGGAIGGTILGARNANQKDDLLATVSEIVNIGGFDSLISYKAAGATFGALSDSEFNAIKAASGPLANHTIMENGRAVGLYGTEAEARYAYELAVTQIQNQLKALNTQVLDTGTQAEVLNILQ